MRRPPLVRASLLLAALCLAAPRAGAQSDPAPGLYYPDWADANDRAKDEPPPQFRLINYFFSRLTLSNAIGDPSGLKGVSLGPLGTFAGSMVYAGGTGNPNDRPGDPGFWVEQRWIPVIEFSPHFVNGLASFRAQFRINYVWGLAANSVQGNIGGGFNANQINIQTKNVNVSLYPTRDPEELTVVVGTQPAYDAAVDPLRNGLFDLTRTGYKLSFLGTDATGVSLYSQKWGRAKLSWLPLGATQPDKAEKNDPRLAFIWLLTADYLRELAPGTWLGGSAWVLRDASKGDAYAYEGLVKSGPSSGGLSSFTGTGPFSIDRPTGTVGWLGVNGHHNLDFRTGRLAASGYAMYNFGGFDSNKDDTRLNKRVDISGFTADLEGLYNWGKGAGDVLSLEAIYSTGDDDLTDGKYKGAFTLNYYGLPGATWFNHRCLLLFPFTSTVVNYTGAVTDVSNQGSGLRALIGAATWDLVPNKLNLKVGVAHGQADHSPVAWPGSTTPRGRILGTELNAELKYTVRYLMTLGLHTGVLFKGNWFDGQTSRVTANPWALFTTFTWYAF